MARISDLYAHLRKCCKKSAVFWLCQATEARIMVAPKKLLYILNTLSNAYLDKVWYCQFVASKLVKITDLYANVRKWCKKSIIFWLCQATEARKIVAPKKSLYILNALFNGYSDKVWYCLIMASKLVEITDLYAHLRKCCKKSAFFDFARPLRPE